MDELPASSALLERILAAAEDLEFRTFVVGFSRPDEGYDREDHERSFRALKVALGEALCDAWPGREVDFDRPEVRFDVRAGGQLDLQLAPLFIGGRYRKHSREIPSTRWIHHRCRGRGCPECGHTGNLCGPSLQELFSAPVLVATGGERTLFHGGGREDTDARMLGRGRPFVLEVFRPRKRLLDLERLSREIAAAAAGLGEALGLAIVGRESVPAVKEAAAEKTYRARVETESPPPPDAEERAASLAGRAIDQRTPRRVAVRRGWYLSRRKTVVESRWLGPFEGAFLFEVRAQAGTYIKELVSGDGGRTSPSLSEVLGVPCRCAALDVLEVHWDPPWEPPRD